MLRKFWTKKRIAMALFVIALLPLGFASLVAVIVYDAENSYRDYDRVKACLQKHQFKVGEGWQHRDMYQDLRIDKFNKTIIQAVLPISGDWRMNWRATS